MIVGMLSQKIEKVLEAKKSYNEVETKIVEDWKHRYTYSEFVNLEDAERELIDTIKQMASDENE